MCGSSCALVPRVMDFAMKAPVISDLPKCRNVSGISSGRWPSRSATSAFVTRLNLEWGQRWLFLQACVFPMEVSYHLYCDVFFLVWEMIKGGDNGTCWAWHVRRALRYCLWRWLHSNLQHCFEKGGCSWYFLLGIVWAGAACRHVWWHFFLTCLGLQMKFFSSTQNRKDGKHGNIMGTFITQHSLNRFSLQKMANWFEICVGRANLGNSPKTTAICCVYMQIIFWYFLILSHFTQYTHLHFSIPHFGVFLCFFFPFFVPPGPCCCRRNSGVAALSDGGTLDMPSDGAWRSWGSGWSWCWTRCKRCPLQKYMKLSELKPFLGFTKKTHHKVKTSPPMFEFWWNVFSCAMKLRQIPWFVVPFWAFFFPGLNIQSVGFSWLNFSMGWIVGCGRSWGKTTRVF